VTIEFKSIADKTPATIEVVAELAAKDTDRDDESSRFLVNNSVLIDCLQRSGW
jgi:hypothetical protein